MTYHAGQVIVCPGQRIDRRHDPARGGDRRTAPRLSPCRQTHGKVTPGTVASIRALPREWSAEGTGRPTLVVRCAGCHGYIELIVESAAREAA